jgi:hypothetical protein
MVRPIMEETRPSMAAILGCRARTGQQVTKASLRGLWRAAAFRRQAPQSRTFICHRFPLDKRLPIWYGNQQDRGFVSPLGSAFCLPQCPLPEPSARRASRALPRNRHARKLPTLAPATPCLFIGLLHNSLYTRGCGGTLEIFNGCTSRDASGGKARQAGTDSEASAPLRWLGARKRDARVRQDDFAAGLCDAAFAKSSRKDGC